MRPKDIRLILTDSHSRFLKNFLIKLHHDAAAHRYNDAATSVAVLRTMKTVALNKAGKNISNNE